MAFGPRHVRMTSATVYHSEESVTDIKINYDVVCTFAAVMLEICAFRPDCLSGAVSAEPLFSGDVLGPLTKNVLITKTGVCPPACILL